MLLSESIESKVQRGMKGCDLVNEVLKEWKSIVIRVAKSELEDKMIEQLDGGIISLR